MKNIIPIKKLSRKEDYLNIMLGGAFLGSGGGGPLKAAQEIIDEILKDGGYVTIVQPEDLEGRKELNGAVVAFMGSPSQGAKGIDMSSPVRAFDTLGELVTSGKLDFTLPIEIGAGNSLIPVMVAVKRGIAVADTDGAGRAVPKIQNTTYALECNATPAVLANGNTGDEKNADICNIIKISGLDKEKVPDALEAYALKLCDLPQFGGMGGLAMYLLNAADILSNTIPGTLSLTYWIGETIRRALSDASEIDPAEALKDFLEKAGWKYYVFGEGKVTEVQKPSSDNDNGLDYGYVIIDDGAGNAMKISYVNENLYAVVNDMRCWAMAPDLICYITKEGPVSNVEIAEGMKVTVFGLPSMRQMRNPQIIATFMQILHDTGIYKGKYVSIEDLHK